jgi:hypothetical protein
MIDTALHDIPPIGVATLLAPQQRANGGLYVVRPLNVAAAADYPIGLAVVIVNGDFTHQSAEFFPSRHREPVAHYIGGNGEFGVRMNRAIFVFGPPDPALPVYEIEGLLEVLQHRGVIRNDVKQSGFRQHWCVRMPAETSVKLDEICYLREFGDFVRAISKAFPEAVERRGGNPLLEQARFGLS